MAIQAQEIEELIRAEFPKAQVTITDLAGDGNHYAAEVIDESFRGKNRIQQQRAVYAALKRKNGWCKRRTSCFSADQKSALAIKIAEISAVN